ncbi:MAG: response regulator [Candidatus Muirbacterium halophilum]|nr:response regulator [Candidatus Muirbacterium halophilum]
MKTISVRALKPGMVLGRPVFDKNKEILLDAGITLTDDYIKKLDSRNIRMVSVLEDEESEDEDIIEEENEDGDEDISPILEKIESINEISYQEILNLLKTVEENIQNNDIRNALFDKINTIENEKVLSQVLDIIVKADLTEKSPLDFLALYSKQSNSDIKNKILKFIKKLKKEDDIITPLIYSMKNNDNYTNNEIYNIMLDYDKENIQKICFKILSENDAKLNTHLVTLMKKLDIAGNTENVKVKIPETKKVIKVEKKIEVKDAKSELLSIKINTPVINDFKNIDEDGLQKKLTSKTDFIETGFTKIEYEAPSVELFKKEYEQSVDSTESLLKNARANLAIDSQSIIQIANKIVSQVLIDPIAAVRLAEFNTLNNYVISHSINVSYMSVLIGHLSKMPEDELMELAIGSLLHDIGMVKVRDLVWNNPQKLEFNDLFDIQKHTIFGVDTLSEMSKFKGNIAYISYQHHERIDGSGYPKNKKGIQVPKYSRIVGIADVFQAMESSRVYRGGYSINHVFNSIMKKDKAKFDQSYVKTLYDFYVNNIDENLSDLGPEPKKILIVDDSPEIRLIATKLIENSFENIEIITASNGSEAIELIKERNERPDLILLDIMMPIMDGFEVIEQLKLHKINIPIMMITAKREQSSVVRAIQSGMVKDYIVKPFDKEMILEKIGKTL